MSISLAGSRSEDLAGRFPAGFVFGTAMASYQIEGATKLDGRTASIWDTFSATPGRVHAGDTGEIATDHYHRYLEDVALMRQLGVDAYRLSLAWPRILPHGGSNPNAAGIAFYDRLVDALLEAGVTPWVTLYHWDLPQELEDAGGWPLRDTAARFAELAHVAGTALGDRVSHWITLNEPWCSAYLGYGSGIHAPGRTEPGAAVAAGHHLLLGHGLAVQALRAAVPEAEVGVTLNLYPVTAAEDRPAAQDAVRRIDGLHNRIFLDPLFRGRYPGDVLMDLGGVTDGAWLKAGDLEVISTPIDFLGVNYYTRHTVSASAYPGTNSTEFRAQGRERTANGWEVDPAGLTEVLLRVREDYTDLPIYVTENGSAWDDHVSEEGHVHDDGRTRYLADHLEACADAIAAGVPLRGYFVWSLLDNFEWAEGYRYRFGLVRVDFDTLARTMKDSGSWYAEFIRAHRRAILGP